MAAVRRDLSLAGHVSCLMPLKGACKFATSIYIDFAFQNVRKVYPDSNDFYVLSVKVLCEYQRLFLAGISNPLISYREKEL